MTKRRGKRATTVDAQVGAKIRALREARGITQQALAAQIDVAFQQVQKYEKGTNRVAASRLFQMARILNVSVNDFFEALPAPSAESRALSDDVTRLHAFVRSREGRELIASFKAITDVSKRRAMLRVVQSMARQFDE